MQCKFYKNKTTSPPGSIVYLRGGWGGDELTYTWVQFLIFLSKLPDTLLSFAPLRIAFGLTGGVGVPAGGWALRGLGSVGGAGWPLRLAFARFSASSGDVTAVLLLSPEGGAGSDNGENSKLVSK